MKPKTKRHKKIVSLNSTVPALTDAQKKWAEKHESDLFDQYFVISRKSYYCLECGSKHRVDDSQSSVLSASVIGWKCPDCKKQLKMCRDYKTSEKHSNYWAIITTYKGNQVVRIIVTNKHMKKKNKAFYEHFEVMQHWIDKKGKITTLSKTVRPMSYYYDAWVYQSDLEIRTVSNGHIERMKIIPDKIYPRDRYLPIVQRNGFEWKFYDRQPHFVISALLKYQKAETLLKAGQTALFKVYADYDPYTDRIERYWKSICIAIRNDYRIMEASDWLDYLYMLEELGKDILNPKYICPDDFVEAHNRANEKMAKIRRKQQIEEQKKEIEIANKNYIERKERFFDICITNGEFEIVPLKRVEEFLVESDTDMLNHCLFNRKYYAKSNSLILSARIDGRPVEHVEVCLRNFSILQSRGYNNLPTKHHDKIVQAVKDNMNEIIKRVKPQKQKYKQAV